MYMCLYQKSVCKDYRTRLQSSATGFLMPFPLFLFPGGITVEVGDETTVRLNFKYVRDWATQIHFTL